MTQEQALAILKSGASVFLTGEPGAGKTFVVNAFVSHLRKHRLEPALTASTGIAATHVGGMTIHSWSGIGIKSALSRYDLDRLSVNERVVRRLTKAHTLIIDEVSMLDARTLDMVDQVCREVRRNPHPFGGLQMVLVGDFFQLPPVSREPSGSRFAFRSAAWDQLHPVTCYLSEQYRQDDPAFLGVLAAIRSNAVSPEHVETLKGRYQTEEPPEDAVKLYSHNVDVDRINAQALSQLDGSTRSFAMRATGPDHLVESLKRGCLSPETLHLKLEASVMFTRNDHQMGAFVNGTLGTVTGFADTGAPIVRTVTGESITAEPMEWKIDDQGKVLASVEQVPLRLAWAMTVHKSQGMSLDAAVMDLGAAFEYGQGYVALSRVRRLSGLYLLGCNERALQVHPDVLAADAQFRRESRTAEEAIASIPAEELLAGQRKFIESCGGKFAAGERARRGTSDPTRAANPDDADAATEESFIAKARRDKPKAWARWTPEDETTLRQLFDEGSGIKAMSEQLGRKPGGIRARLVKLGLMEE